MRFEFDKRTRLLILGGLLVLALGLLVRFYPALVQSFDRTGEVAARELTLRKYQKVLQSGASLEGELEALRRTLNRLEAGLLSGTTASLAAADIQSILNSIADQSQVQTKTVRVLKAEPVEGQPYLSVPVEFTITCSTRQLKEILYRIESSPKYLTVQKLRITVIRRGRDASSEQVQGDVTVVGFMRQA